MATIFANPSMLNAAQINGMFLTGGMGEQPGCDYDDPMSDGCNLSGTANMCLDGQGSEAPMASMSLMMALMMCGMGGVGGGFGGGYGCPPMGGGCVGTFPGGAQQEGPGMGPMTMGGPRMVDGCVYDNNAVNNAGSDIQRAGKSIAGGANSLGNGIAGLGDKLVNKVDHSFLGHIPLLGGLFKAGAHVVKDTTHFAAGVVGGVGGAVGGLVGLAGDGVTLASGDKAGRHQVGNNFKHLLQSLPSLPGRALHAFMHDPARALGEVAPAVAGAVFTGGAGDAAEAAGLAGEAGDAAGVAGEAGAAAGEAGTAAGEAGTAAGEAGTASEAGDAAGTADGLSTYQMPQTQAEARQLLGLDDNASAADISKAYRRLARQNHPDLNPDQVDLATENMKAINTANDLLSNG